MGRFGIGARVRDADGDEGVIVGKPEKGKRDVKYEGNTGDRAWLNGETIWWRKSDLTLVEDAAPAAQEPADSWVPKVGDRVRLIKEGRSTTGAVGKFATIEAWADGRFVDGDQYLLNIDGPVDCETVAVTENYTRATIDCFELVAAEEPAGLVIEVGKFYRTRDGRKVGPMESIDKPWTDMHGDTAAFRGLIDGHKDDYTSAGLWLTRYGEDRAEDLVAEWVVEPAAAEATTDEVAVPKFKVGDTIERTGNFAGWAPKGFKAEYLEGGMYVDAFGDKTLVVETQWSLATPAPAATPAESFIVARLTSKGQPRPNARPRVHATLAAAEQEAQRLADRLGDEFAVYQRVSSKTVDAGPVPKCIDLDSARLSLTSHGNLNRAFVWAGTGQGHRFWHSQCETGLTPPGRAILRKWIAEVEAATQPTKEAA